MSVAAAMQRHSDAGYLFGDYRRRTLVKPMLSKGVRHCCQGKAQDAQITAVDGSVAIHAVPDGIHCKSDATCNPARETLCQSLIFPILTQSSWLDWSIVTTRRMHF